MRKSDEMVQNLTTNWGDVEVMLHFRWLFVRGLYVRGLHVRGLYVLCCPNWGLYVRGLYVRGLFDLYSLFWYAFLSDWHLFPVPNWWYWNRIRIYNWPVLWGRWLPTRFPLTSIFHRKNPSLKSHVLHTQKKTESIYRTRIRSSPISALAQIRVSRIQRRQRHLREQMDFQGRRHYWRGENKWPAQKCEWPVPDRPHGQIGVTRCG